MKKKKKIVFYTDTAQIRELKHLIGLKEHSDEYEVVLIAYKALSNFDFGKYCDRVYLYGNGNSSSNTIERHLKTFLHRMDIFRPLLKHVLSIIQKEQPQLVHSFLSYKHEMTDLLIRNINIPVIVDSQDFLGISYGLENVDKRIRLKEKFCLENASGLIRKGPQFETNYYRVRGYKIECPEIQILPYCEEKFFVDNAAQKLSDQDGSFHLVYTGAVSADPDKRYQYFIPLARVLSTQGIHLHLYHSSLGVQSSKEYKVYYKETKSNPFLHLHSCTYEHLSKEISCYDFGLSIHERYPMPLWTFDKMKTSIGNKFFSYLEANLPIIVSDHIEYNKYLVEKHDVGFSVKDEELSELKNLISRNHRKWNIEDARRKFSLKNNIRKLEQFYRSIINKEC